MDLSLAASLHGRAMYLGIESLIALPINLIKALPG